MYDTGINVFCKIIERALKSTKISLILPFMRDPSTCERERVEEIHFTLPRNVGFQSNIHI